MTNYKEQLKDITTFVFDYDGVLTDGTVVLMRSGDALRTANVRDGYAMHMAIKKGYRIVIITGGFSRSLLVRFRRLNVKDVFLGVENKLKKLNDYMAKNKITPEHVLYMGDDIPDYELMKIVGLPTCPADACEEIKNIARYISPYSGGKGCVRDVIEQVMKIQGKWMNHDAFSW
jgi:3-deoxy-D-manno-octulosonate 8-phosphate phosphatase (KDO 8-P phosphatase)